MHVCAQPLTPHVSPPSLSQLVAHLMGCLWYFIAQDAGLGSGTWADSYHMVTRPIVSRYIISLYWAFVTVSLGTRP